MTIAQVQKAEASGTAATTASVTYSPAPVEGNLMVAVIATQVDKTLTVPSGWTLVLSILNTSRTSMYFKVAGAGEATVHNWTWTGTTTWAAFGHEYSGTSLTPLDQSATSSGNSTAPRTGAITPASGDVVCVGGIGIFRGETLTSPVGGYTVENEEIPDTNLAASILEKITVGGSSEEGGGGQTANKLWGGINASFLSSSVPLQRARRRREL